METLLIMLNTKHDQNLSSGSGDIAVKPIFWMIKVLWWPWKLDQGHRIPFCNGDPPNYAKYQTWSEFIHQFLRNRSETIFQQKFYVEKGA